MVHFGMPASVTKRLRQFGAAARGVAGVELALTAPFLAIGLVNAVDVGIYAYRRMEVENAAEVGAHAAYNTCVPPCTSDDCPPQHLPATYPSGNCPGLNAAITAAIQSTTLENLVSLASGYPKEGYYCVDASNALQPFPDGSSVSYPRPACSGGGAAGDYLRVEVTYSYSPLFSGPISVMNAVMNNKCGSTTCPITKTTWMRMG